MGTLASLKLAHRPASGADQPRSLPMGVAMADQNQGRGDSTGAGAEAAEGIHSADRGRRDQEKNPALEEADRQADGDERRGSEPTTSHSTEHKSQYGGGGENGGA